MTCFHTFMPWHRRKNGVAGQHENIDMIHDRQARVGTDWADRDSFGGVRAVNEHHKGWFPDGELPIKLIDDI